MAAVEPVRSRTSRNRARYVIPSPMSEIAWARYSRRKSGMRSRARMPTPSGGGRVSHWSAPRCRRGVDDGHGVERDDEAPGHGVRGVVVVAVLLEQPGEPLAELGGTNRRQPGEAAREQQPAIGGGVRRCVDAPEPDGELQLRARRVEHRPQRLVEDREALVGVGREQRPVELERRRDDVVAGLDDPGHDPPLDRADEVALEEQLDVVVEARLRQVERRRQLLHRPGGIPALDHRLEDPHPGRVADRTQGLHVADVADLLGLEIGVEAGRCRRVASVRKDSTFSLPRSFNKC